MCIIFEFLVGWLYTKVVYPPEVVPHAAIGGNQCVWIIAQTIKVCLSNVTTLPPYLIQYSDSE